MRIELPNIFQCMFTIKPVTDTAWDDFVLGQEQSLFVQSSSYGVFYEAMGENYFILGLYQDEQLVGGSLIVTTHAKRGNFLYLPYGPLLPEDGRDEAFLLFTQELRSVARRDGYAFVRVSPFLQETDDICMLFQKSGFRRAPMHVLAETTWLLNVQHRQDVLLSGMKKNHRNLIHRCEKEGVVILQTTDSEQLGILNDMLDETERRHHFVRFPRAYVNAEFDIFSKKGNALLFLARLPDGRYDAAAVIMFFGNMAVYRHSASLNLDKRLPTSYLIQWRVIQEAKKRGMTYYNFWGISPQDAHRLHPFMGITHFKKGFGGYQRDVLPCQDLVISKWYWLNWIVEKMRSMRRGF